MGFSTATNQIIQALSDIADEYSFGFKKEVPYFPQLRHHSERVDVEFLIPEGRPVLRFEIDNDPDRAAHNRLKIFGNIYLLSSLPVVALAVHHGRVAVAPHGYPRELLDRGFVVPPRFLDSVSVDNSSFKTIAVDLRQWLQKLIADLATAPEWGSVFDIAEQYQPLVRNLSLEVAAAHLDMHSELAWFLVGNNRLDVERAACLSITLARMLQRAGHHSRAQHHIQTFRSRLCDTRSLSATTEDDARAIAFLLNQPDFDEGGALEHLSIASVNVRAQYNKSKFLWRKAIAHIIHGDANKAENVIASYLSLMEGGNIARSNVALLRTLMSLCLRCDDPRKHSDRYSRHERFLLAQPEGAPDGTVHGVVTSLYLKVIAEIACGNTLASDLLPKLDAFCSDVGLPQTADGLREIRFVLPPSSSSDTGVMHAGTETLSSLLTRGRRDALDRLCAEIDVVCS